MWTPTVIHPVDLPRADNEYLTYARIAAEKSHDPKRQVGCVIVHDGSVSAASNRAPDCGISAEALASDLRREYIAHAEPRALLRAVYEAGIYGSDMLHPLAGATLYLTPSLPCGQCAGLALDMGVRRFVVGLTHISTHWRAGHAVGMELMKRHGAALIVVTKLDNWMPY